jgi:hypothetical protein
MTGLSRFLSFPIHWFFSNQTPDISVFSGTAPTPPTPGHFGVPIALRFSPHLQGAVRNETGAAKSRSGFVRQPL